MTENEVLDTARWFAWKYRMDPDDCSQVALIAAWEFGNRWDAASIRSPERRCGRRTYVSRNVFQTLFEGYRQTARRGAKKQVLLMGVREQEVRASIPDRPAGFVETLMSELGEDARAVCRILFESDGIPDGVKSVREMLTGMGWTVDRVETAFLELKEAAA